MPTARIEEYLEAIFKLQQETHPVSVSRLAESLNLSAASVSEMLKRLKQNSLVHTHKSKGVCLTTKGEKLAKQTVRRHRLSERLLTDILGYKWDEVHEEACKLEHAIGPELEEKIAKSLGDPQTCPHGHTIPREDGTFVEEKTRRLCDLEPGEKATIVRVSQEDSKMLHYLATLGLMPNIEIEIEEIAPFGGPLLIRIKGKGVRGSKYALGREIASKILVSWR